MTAAGHELPPASAGSVLVVGAGIIGLAAAWQLARRGHAVSLIDPALACGPGRATAAEQGLPLSGSVAALGVLMGHLFQRSSGRAWRLRDQSLRLWPTWLEELGRNGHRLPRRPGVLVLASSEEDLARQARIAAERQRQGFSLRCLEPAELAGLQPRLPGRPLGGLLSPLDGQLDPGPLLEALGQEVRRAGVTTTAEAVVAVERGQRWRLRLAGGGCPEADWLVLAAGLGTEALLRGLGHALPLEPVLGQALDLELASEPAWNWPGVVVWRGINLIPRPDLEGGRRLWLGATLEPGVPAGSAALEAMRALEGEAPAWLAEAREVRRWRGWRNQPRGRPAPLLEEPEAGLLVACGHYRNGVLLAPATVHWLCERISAGSRAASQPPGPSPAASTA